MIKLVIFDMYETLVTMCQSPTYKGADIALDLGITESKFREIWNPSENERTLGHVSFRTVIEQSMQENHCYTEELLQKILLKRKLAEQEYFKHLHPQIIPMLEGLQAQNLKVALITNCYLEEREAIMGSSLWKYFSFSCMSCDLGIKKPDVTIFLYCMEKLDVKADECLYVGDGGSFELETARDIGMRAVQAVWYLQDGYDQPVGRLEKFIQLEAPMDIFSEI